jgi:hypothetical protein
MNAVNLLITDAYGVYIPQRFVQEFLDPIRGSWQYVGDWPRGECAAGPYTDGYWEAWDEILNRATYTDEDGHTYCLWQDGDLWLLDSSRMTDEEKRNFGFEEF